MSTRAYVIIASEPAGRFPGRPRAGRHRLGAPGTAPRYPAGPPARPRAQRARHRRTDAAPVSAVRYTTLVVLLGTLAVSGWFAASGASAVAQMIQP